MKILVTGGTGYIGSHTCVELLNKGYEVVVFDNLYNSKIDVVDKIEKITGKKITFYKADMLDKESMRPIFEEHKLDAVIHFAGLKAVGESVAKPLMYMAASALFSALRQQFMVIRRRFRLRRRARKEPVQIRMDGRSRC